MSISDHTRSPRLARIHAVKGRGFRFPRISGSAPMDPDYRPPPPTPLPTRRHGGHLLSGHLDTRGPVAWPHRGACPACRNQSRQIAILDASRGYYLPGHGRVVHAADGGGPGERLAAGLSNQAHKDTRPTRTLTQSSHLKLTPSA